MTRLGQWRTVLFEIDISGMRVAVDDAGNDEPGIEVRYGGRFADVLTGTIIVADKNETITPDCDSLGPRLAGIDRVDLAARQNPVCGSDSIVGLLCFIAGAAASEHDGQ